MRGRFDRSAASRGAVLTERDMAIVEAVFLARYLTLDLICQVFFSQGARSSAKRRTRILFDRRFLDKRRASPNAPDVYYLGMRGVRHVEDLVGDGRFGGDFDVASVGKIRGVSGAGADNPDLFLVHELALSRVYVDAMLEARRQGMGLRWLPARALELRKLGFEPDAFLDATYVDSEGRKRGKAAFVEFTQVLPKDLPAYVAERQRYLALKKCRGDFGVGSASFLWLTTSRAKRQKILDVISQTVQRDWWHAWYAALWPDVRGLVLTGAVWEGVSSEERAAFLTLKREKSETVAR